MRYYCNICLLDIKKKSKISHLKSKSHKEFERYKHIILYLYMKDYNKKFTQYLLKRQFK